MSNMFLLFVLGYGVLASFVAMSMSSNLLSSNSDAKSKLYKSPPRETDGIKNVGNKSPSSGVTLALTSAPSTTLSRERRRSLASSRMKKIKNSPIASHEKEEYYTTIADWPFPRAPRKLKDRTHWCIIGRHAASKAARRYFEHFPHAAENLLPCWSWWRRWKVTDRCGVILMDEMHIPEGSWQDQLLQRWECRIRELGYDAEDRAHPIPDNDVFYTPSLYWKNPRYGQINFVDQPEDAWALRRMFISDTEIRQFKQPIGMIQVGIIQRLNSRIITNLDDITALLKKEIPNANITVTSDLGMNITEQATWFATKDVIIGAHGAAMMNCLFILPRTIVMQLYPPNYFFQSLEPLVEKVGGIALDWYNGTDPADDWRNAVHNGKNNKVRDGNITPSPNEVIDPILFVMGRKPTPSGWDNSHNITGTNWTKKLLWMGR